jgi:lipoteichoic acid synthase
MNQATGNSRENMRIVSVIGRVIARPEFTIAVLFAALLFYKFKLMQSAARGPRLFLAMIQHDGAIVALMLLFYAAGSAAARWDGPVGLRRTFGTISTKLCLAACLLVLLVYAIDVFVYQFFNTRLYVADIVTFSSEWRAGLSLIRSGLKILRHHRRWVAMGLVMALPIVRAFYKLLTEPLRSPIRGRFLAAIAVFLVILSLVPFPFTVFSFWDRFLYQNFIERNEGFFINTNFSDAFRAKVLAQQPAEACHPGRGRRLNVILLIVESLSAYDSHYYSGIEDWTPRLDGIARQETALTNFYANGWTTMGGLVSMLGRTFPFVPEHTAYNQFGAPMLTDYLDVPQPLPRGLNEQGYMTEFIAGGDTTFIGQEKWLKAMGFQKEVGISDPRFVVQKIRGPFNSVPDRLLYSVALEEVSGMPKDRPYFLTVQTFWSHRPFTDQNGGRADGEEPVVREVDAQIGALYDRLMAAGFFQSGLLFITGDHRAPERFRKEEYQRFGASTPARIPGLIATHALNLPRVLTEDFQQRDFGASVESLISDQYCLGPQEGSFLSNPPTPSSCILQARGDDRDLIFVKCGTAEGTVHIAGDATRFVSGAVPDEASIIQTVNRNRARPVH